MTCYRIARMGWLPDPMDHRDFRVSHDTVKKALTATRKAVPSMKKASATAKKVDLRGRCSRIENQGNIGSCTAHAVVGLLEYLWKQAYSTFPQASRLFLYKATRNFLGWTGDTGAFVRSTIKALRLFGTCPEDYWPYEQDQYDVDPPAFCYSFARNYRALVYYRLDENLNALRESLRSQVPFAFGFTCFESIDEEGVADTGMIPFPEKGEQSVGGHAIMAVGFDENKKSFIIRNSWGRGWGEKGYGYLPYKYFQEGLADDCWALLRSDYEPLDS